MTLQKETRDAIGRTVRSLRELFEAEFGKQASGRFGIRSSPRGHESDGSELDAWLDPVESLSLTPAEFAQRSELIHALRYLTSEGNKPGEAVARLAREAAFTAVNRLLAIRVAEAIGVLSPALSSGRQSAGYRDTIGDLFPGLAHDEDDYWLYLQIAGDELAPAVPRLFDRRHPTSGFTPSRACVDAALELLTVDELADAWHEPETLGWGYQFFNGDDVKEMRDASSAPRNSRELAVRNQFFTPGYVVDWLVQNTLGRRLVQAGYELELPLLVGEVDGEDALALEDVRVLDPAVGSGHFLLGSYDLLERAWQSTGVPPKESAAKILPCLFGVDIDPRAAQVAQAVLLLRARRSSPNANLTPSTIVTAVALPQNRELREQAFGGLSPAARHLADEIAEALDQAPVLGSLVDVAQRFQVELERHQTAPRLAVDGDTTGVLNELRNALDDLVSKATSAEQRMFTAEAADALKFFEVCQERYDTVLMNPPFGEGVPGEARRLIKDLYPDWWTELYACFLTRAFDLVTERGLVGMLSSSRYFITRKMRELREVIADTWPPLAVIDLGGGVLSGATVDTALSVFQNQRKSGVVDYADLTRTSVEQREMVLSGVKGPLSTVTFDIRRFQLLDRTPFAFHVPEAVLKLWERPERLEPEVAHVRTGNNTFDDFRFLRLRWEIPDPSAGWHTYQKGGDYKPYLEPAHMLIDLRCEAHDLKANAMEAVGSTAQVMQSSDYWYMPGLTSPRASSIGFGARIMPRNEVFNGLAVSIFPHNISVIEPLLALTNSTIFAEVIRVFGRGRMTENGALKAMPISMPMLADLAGTTDTVHEIVDIFYKWECRDETSPYFGSPLALDGPTSSREAEAEWRADEERLTILQGELDLAAQGAFGVNAGEVVDPDVRRRTKLVPNALRPARSPSAMWAHDVISWGVGVAFGRWDGSATAGRASIADLMEGLPTHPPGAGGSVGQSLTRALYTSSEALAGQVEATLSAVRSSLVEEVLDELGIGNLAEWLDTKYFAKHLARYSRSRRYAPIYWQLLVPSKSWGLWLYAPSLTRESLFAIARTSREKLSSLNEQINFARERSETDRGVRERAEELEDLAAEVEKFATIADAVAQSGWEPDLNDGFVLNAAPLEELFVDKKWRGQIAKHRKAMQKGDYPWATVQHEFFEKRT